MISPTLAEKIKTRSSAVRIAHENPTDLDYILDFVKHRSRVADPRLYCMKTIKESPIIYEIWRRGTNDRGVHYICSHRACSCPSWAWQDTHKEEIREYLPEFQPLCKHQSLIAKLTPMPLTYKSKSMVMWGDRDGCTLTWISHDGITFQEYKMLATIEDWIEARNKTLAAGWHFNYVSPGTITRLNRSTRKTIKRRTANEE